jgi:hypothetical protein
MKIMKKQMKRILGTCALLVSMTGLSSCGGAGVVDPLSLFGSGSPPQLDPIVSGLTGGVFSGNAFTSSSPYWVFTSVGGFGGLAYIAPADGIVIGSGPINTGGISGVAVTIAHSGKLATRYIGIAPIVRIGDSVIRGQTIGTLTSFGGASQIAFQVLLDGSPVCPLTFLSATFKAQMTNYFGAAGFLCQ